MESTIATHLDVRPLSPVIGAEIHGVDLAGPIDSATVAAIRAALVQWKVIFFRDQRITPAQQVEFGRYFGTVTPAHPTLPPVYPDLPEILLLDNEVREQQQVDGQASNIASCWHTDVTFVPNPPLGSILRGVVVPQYGGDTQFTNLVAAYESLSAPLRRLCDELHAVHQNVLPLIRGDRVDPYAAEFMSRPIKSVHPIVRVHPESGERALFVNRNFTRYIVELSNRESDRVLELLYAHTEDPFNTVRFRWERDSIAFWDNRATAHLAPIDVPHGERRTMHRITIAGDLPVGPDGFRSHPLEGDLS